MKKLPALQIHIDDSIYINRSLERLKAHAIQKYLIYVWKELNFQSLNSQFNTLSFKLQTY